MSAELTETERAYLECETPMLSGGDAALRLIGGFFASFARAVVSPSSEYNNTDSKLIRTAKEILYTKYKKAVLHKAEGALTKRDTRVLKKLNRLPFVLAEDTYDPDKFVEEIYAEYMKTHTEDKT